MEKGKSKPAMFFRNAFHYMCEKAWDPTEL